MFTSTFCSCCWCWEAQLHVGVGCCGVTYGNSSGARALCATTGSGGFFCATLNWFGLFASFPLEGSVLLFSSPFLSSLFAQVLHRGHGIQTRLKREKAFGHAERGRIQEMYQAIDQCSTDMFRMSVLAQQRVVDMHSFLRGEVRPASCCSRACCYLLVLVVGLLPHCTAVMVVPKSVGLVSVDFTGPATGGDHFLFCICAPGAPSLNAAYGQPTVLWSACTLVPCPVFISYALFPSLLFHCSSEICLL